MNRLVFPVVLLCGLLAFALGCAHAPSGHWEEVEHAQVSGSGTFRVLSLNIAHGVRQPMLGFMATREDVERNLSSIGRALARENADVVGLQEVHVHGLPDEDVLDHLQHLADGAGYGNRFYGNHYVPNRKDLQKGAALLSHLALEDVRSTAFAAADGDDHGWVVATIRPEGLGGAAIDVVNLHLDPFSPSRRVAQMEDLVEVFRNRSRPLVVMGDFNSDWGGRDGVRHLAEALGLTAYRPQDGPRTYPTALPVQRLDWILVSGELRILRYRTFREPATDHRGVVAEVGFSPQAWAQRQGARARLQLAARLQEVRGALMAEAGGGGAASPPMGGAGRPVAPIIEGPPTAAPGRLLVAETAAEGPRDRALRGLARAPSAASAQEATLAEAAEEGREQGAPLGLAKPGASRPIPMSVAGTSSPDPLAAFLEWLGDASGPPGQSFWQVLQGPGERRPVDVSW
ncbi:MAG TPA: endonuclease/exonuclease/phosphatase family protein [Myxococcaceae bacterium]|nr:endonuclease/exonuclease/phosphatase family protein [Myxococcaceae bacterium]